MSELAVTVGLQRTHHDGTPYTSPITLWARLSGMLPRYDTTSSPDAEIGRWGEVAVGYRYAEEHGLVWGADVIYGPTLEQPGLVHPEIPWLHARPDLLNVKLKRPVELKFPRDLDPERWGPTGTSDMPGEHACQVVGQLAVCHRLFGSEVGELAAMARAPATSPRVWVEYQLERDERLEAGLLRAAWEWVETFVQGGRCPPPDGSADADRTLRRLWANANPDKKRVATPDELERFRRILQVREARDELIQRASELRQGIQIAMEDCTVLTDADGTPIVTWRTGRDGRRRFRILTNNAILEDDS